MTSLKPFGKDAWQRAVQTYTNQSLLAWKKVGYVTHDTDAATRSFSRCQRPLWTQVLDDLDDEKPDLRVSNVLHYERLGQAMSVGSSKAVVFHLDCPSMRTKHLRLHQLSPTGR